LIDPLFLLTRQLCGNLCCRANNEKLESKQRSAVAADSQTKASTSLLGAAAAAAAASTDSQTQLHELKKRNDELEDEVRLLC